MTPQQRFLKLSSYSEGVPIASINQSMSEIKLKRLLYAFALFLSCFGGVFPYYDSVEGAGTAGKSEGQSHHRGSNYINDKERVVFGGKLELLSQPLPFGVTRESLIRFFEEEKESNIILIASAGGDRVTERISRTSELDGYWHECCHDTYGLENLPSGDDPIFTTKLTTSYKALFFELTTTTYNGIKTIIPSSDDDDSLMPSYVFNMIAEQQHPEGLAPIVWAFHKICSFCAERDSLKPCGRAQSIMSVAKVVVDNHDDEWHNPHYYALSFSINISIEIEFPKRHTRILPLSTEQVEKVVSKAILKAVSKDVERNLEVFHQLFLNWYHSTDRLAEGGEAKDCSNNDVKSQV